MAGDIAALSSGGVIIPPLLPLTLCLLLLLYTHPPSASAPPSVQPMSIASGQPTYQTHQLVAGTPSPTPFLLNPVLDSIEALLHSISDGILVDITLVGFLQLLQGVVAHVLQGWLSVTFPPDFINDLGHPPVHCTPLTAFLAVFLTSALAALVAALADSTAAGMTKNGSIPPLLLLPVFDLLLTTNFLLALAHAILILNTHT